MCRPLHRVLILNKIHYCIVNPRTGCCCEEFLHLAKRHGLRTCCVLRVVRDAELCVGIKLAPCPTSPHPLESCSGVTFFRFAPTKAHVSSQAAAAQVAHPVMVIVSAGGAQAGGATRCVAAATPQLRRHLTDPH